MSSAKVIAVAVCDEAYVVGLRGAVAAALDEVAVDYGIDEHAVDGVVEVVEHVVICPDGVLAIGVSMCLLGSGLRFTILCDSLRGRCNRFAFLTASRRGQDLMSLTCWIEDATL